MKVVITPRGFARFGLDEIARMEEAGHEVHYNDTGEAYSHEQFVSLIRDADAIIVGVDRLDRDTLAQCKQLKVVCKFGVGVDNIDLSYCQMNGIAVERCIGTNSRAVAEHVLAMILDHAKNLTQSVNEVRSGHWIKRTGGEVAGKSLGILGFGRIGKYLAKYARGLEMDVFVSDALAIDPEEAQKYHVHVEEADQLFRHCDYVSIHVPLTDETRGMIDQFLLATMKKNSCLINTARGELVDQEALFEALQKGPLHAAYFDVFDPEPPQEGNPLLSLSNFYLTPHTAARTEEAERRTCIRATEQILKHL